jgi:hypothetical protein
MVSVSAVPGGNPVAKDDPENWAMEYGRCPTCNAHWCDRCLAKLSAPKCPKDAATFTRHGPVPLQPAAPPPSAPVATSAKPWWKFWG